MEGVSYHQPLPVCQHASPQCSITRLKSRGRREGQTKTQTGGKEEEKKILGGGVMTKTNESGDHIPPFILSFLPWRSIVTPFSSWQTFCVFAASGCLTENCWRATFLWLGPHALHQSSSSKSLLPISNHQYSFSYCRSEWSDNESLT